MLFRVKHSMVQYTMHGTEYTFHTVGCANEVGDKHGFSEDDIRRAIRMRICNVRIDEYEDKYALIGFDTRGNTLEILYNFLGNETMKVYHAMTCRKAFWKKYGPKGGYHGC